MSILAENKPVRVAVVTGQHPFDVVGLHALLRGLPGIDWYLQDLDQYAATPTEVRRQYQVVLFYNMHQGTPSDAAAWYERGAREALVDLGRSDQGILLLHHALVAYPDWPLWDELVGIEERRADVAANEALKVHVENPEHPITQGLSDWEMTDEAYAMPEAPKGCDVVLTVDHPKSLRTLAWTHTYRDARVFCFQSGHDQQTYANPHFRTVLVNGIRWCARRE